MTDQSNTPQPRKEKLTPTRATPRQGTSHVAWRGERPGEEDPLLAFTPVPHARPRRNSITPKRQREFIAELSATGLVYQAALYIGASTEALYKLRNRPGAEEFRAAWDAAIDRGIARLEDSALMRALEGDERMVVSGGKHMGFQRVYNDNLVMFFLRNRRARRYQLQAEIGPGHPVWEKVAKAYAEEQRAYNYDPQRVAKIRQGMNVKMAEWRRNLEAVWEAERQHAIEKGETPRLPHRLQRAVWEHDYDPELDGAGRDEGSEEEFYDTWTGPGEGDDGEED